MVENGPMVFVVDDDLSVRRSLNRLLRSAGFVVETFESAGDFLRQGLGKACGCLILDVRMPDMSGLELQEQLGSSGSTLPIIFITAHHAADAREQAMAAGAVAFINKPFDQEDLLTALRDALARGSGKEPG